jgi:hypothetical protein
VSTASSDSRRDFHEKLVLSVFDKLVLGLLVVLAGFVLNLVLQNRQSNQATKAEIARLRVARVAEVWEALDTEQQAIDRLGKQLSGLAKATALVEQDMNNAQGPRAVPADRQEVMAHFAGLQRLYRQIARSEKTARAKEREVFQVLHSDRFWIGEKIYPSYITYATREHQLFQTYRNIGVGALTLQFGEAAQGTAREHADYQTWLEGQQAKLKTEKADLLKARLDVFAVIEKLS